MSEFEIDLEEDDGFGSSSAEGKVNIDQVREERDKEVKRLRDRITGSDREHERERDKNGDRKDRRGNLSSRNSSIPTGPRALQGRGGHHKPTYSSNSTQNHNNNFNSGSFYGFNNNNSNSNSSNMNIESVNYNYGYNSEHNNIPYSSNPDYPTNALYISGMEWWINEENIRDWIIEAGQPENEIRTIIFDDHKFNGRSKGVVYVEFNNIQVSKNVRQYIEKKSDLKSSDGDSISVIYVHSTSTPFRSSMTKSKSEQRRIKNQQQHHYPQSQPQPQPQPQPQQVGTGANAIPGSTVNSIANPMAGQMNNPGMMYGNPMMYGFPNFWMQPGYLNSMQGAPVTNQNNIEPTIASNGQNNLQGVKRPRDD